MKFAAAAGSWITKYARYQTRQVIKQPEQHCPTLSDSAGCFLLNNIKAWHSKPRKEAASRRAERFREYLYLRQHSRSGQTSCLQLNNSQHRPVVGGLNHVPRSWKTLACQAKASQVLATDPWHWCTTHVRIRNVEPISNRCVAQLIMA